MKSARALVILAIFIALLAACTVAVGNKDKPVTSTSGSPDPREFSLLTDEFEDLIFWRSFDTNEGAQQELAQATTRWGILAEKVETWKSIASQAGESKEKWSLGNGIGPTGLIVGLNASIKNGVQVFQYTLNLDPRNYTLENMENIRETGLSRRVIN